MLKQCSKCKKSKLLNEFHKDKVQKDGYYPQCKKCKSAYGKEFWRSPRSQHHKDYEKRPDVRKKRRKYMEKYRQTNKYKLATCRYRKHHSKEGRDYYLKYYYGITLNQYNNILEKQNGVCVICGKAESLPKNKKGEIKPLSVDHNHNTREIRGLLCTKCNWMLGSSNENPDILRRAIKYLEEHK